MPRIEEHTVTLYSWEQLPQRVHFTVSAEPPVFRALECRCIGTRKKNYKKEQQFWVDAVLIYGACPAFNIRERLLIRRVIKEKLGKHLGLAVRMPEGTIQLSEAGQCG